MGSLLLMAAATTPSSMSLRSSALGCAGLRESQRVTTILKAGQTRQDERGEPPERRGSDAAASERSSASRPNEPQGRVSLAGPTVRSSNLAIPPRPCRPGAGRGRSGDARPRARALPPVRGCLVRSRGEARSVANDCASKIKRGKRQQPYRCSMKMTFKKKNPNATSALRRAGQRSCEPLRFDKVAYAAALEVLG